MTDRNRSGLAYGALFVLGAGLGILALGLLRFLNVPPEQPVHYHANWALFVDGQRVDLTLNRYMEDVFQCTADPSSQRPEDRIHMHENNQDVVHVHASGVAWGHLLANLGFGVGDDYIELEGVRQEADSVNTLKFVINGRPVRSIRNLPVGDQDRLLISYGPESAEEVLATQFEQVASSAGEFNTMRDPASCSGQQVETVGERLRRALWY